MQGISITLLLIPAVGRSYGGFIVDDTVEMAVSVRCLCPEVFAFRYDFEVVNKLKLFMGI